MNIVASIVMILYNVICKICVKQCSLSSNRSDNCLYASIIMLRPVCMTLALHSFGDDFLCNSGEACVKLGNKSESEALAFEWGN